MKHVLEQPVIGLDQTSWPRLETDATKPWQMWALTAPGVVVHRIRDDKSAATFAEGADCVLLENHGVVIGGRDLREAFQRFETLEFVAQTLIHAAALGPLKVLPPEHLRIDTMPEFGELPDTAPSNREKELRTAISRFLHRAYQQRLLISTAGAFSARLDDISVDFL